MMTACAFVPGLIVLPGLDGLAGLCSEFSRSVTQRVTPNVKEVSYPADRALGFDQLTDLVMRDLEKREDDYVVMAQSFSGHVAMRMAMRRPRGLRGVVFVNSFVRSPLTAFPSQFISSSPLVSTAVTSVLPPKTIARRIMFGSDAPHQLVDELFTNVRKVTPKVLSHRLKLCLNTDSSSIWRDEFAYGIPLLYLEGEKDPLQAFAVGTNMQKSIQALERKQIENGPHMLIQRYPQLCADIMAEFYEQL